LSIQTWMDLCHPEDLIHSNALLDKHFKRESANYQCEARMKHKNGAWIWILDHGRVIEWDEDGNPLRMIGTHTDITERKRVETEKLELETQNWQLQKTESLGRMAGAIAHHFNNLLQVVMGNLEIAIDDLPRGSGRLGSLVEAMSASHKAMEISGLMLTYLGQTHGSHEPLDLSGICRNSLTLLQASAPKDARLKADFPYPGPVILANANQIQQILTNLVSNAWEAFDGRDGTVNLTIRTVSQADIPAGMKYPIDWQPQNIAYACLEVTDKGRGIGKRDIEKIFDPFFTTKFTGRGLGLPVAVGIAKAHGGGITVESDPGGGSIFRVFLPVSDEETFWLDALPEKTSVTPARSERNSSPGPGDTVLVVEDDEQVRKLTCSMLAHLGYPSLEANDGLEAVGVFRQHHGDIGCVLSDLTMPHMDGWDTLTALREISPGIPVILSSGYDEAQIMSAGHPERPDAFLSKPYHCKDLGDAIARVLGK
jgi:signal transduction histidine kinase